MLYSFCSVLAFICAKLFLRLEVNGVENIPKKGGIIVASNHASLLDPVLIGATFSKYVGRIGFMAKEELFHKKLFNFILLKLNAFPINRNRRDIGAIKEAIRRLKNGGALLMFPEGTRATDKNSASIQAGIGLLAIRTKCPILPTHISGTDKALAKGNKFIRFTKVAINFGKPYWVEDNDTYSEIAEQVMLKISSLQK